MTPKRLLFGALFTTFSFLERHLVTPQPRAAAAGEQACAMDFL
jgi:hypothetical protein